jgi:LacI family transcriptional regulator, gluconate utilization system Gnt-I transcriptional repressor
MDELRLRPGGGGGAVRMRDVAQRAGVSAMTVSRVLSDPERVSAEVRGRVQAAIRESGYVPNRLAGSLSSSRSTVVGLVVPSIRNALFADTIQGISDVLRESGHHLMVADSRYSPAEEEALITAFLAQRVAGLMLHNTTHSAQTRALVRRAGVPVVENGTLVADPLDMGVSYSNADAARAMTLHLARLGYRRIALVTLPVANNARSAERRRGYRAALAEAGLAEDPRLVLEMPPGLPSGVEAIGRLVGMDPAADAVFFAGDVLAVGALLECGRRGWAVPGRVAIASFDDLEILRQLNPPITTVRLPRREIGRRSAEILLDRIRGRSAERIRVDLGFEIIQRGSS